MWLTYIRTDGLTGGNYRLALLVKIVFTEIEGPVLDCYKVYSYAYDILSTNYYSNITDAIYYYIGNTSTQWYAFKPSQSSPNKADRIEDVHLLQYWNFNRNSPQ